MDGNKIDSENTETEWRVEIRDSTKKEDYDTNNPETVVFKNEKSTNEMQDVELRVEPRSNLDAERVPSGPSWKPYEDAGLEVPVTFFMPPIYYKIRWAWVRFFMKNIIFDISVGEIIVFLLCIAAALVPVGVAGAGSGNELDESTGGAATVPLILVFAVVTRNSIFTLLFGTPFERTLKWHKWLAVLSVGSGVWHGVVSKKANVSGIILTSLMGALVIFSFFPFRRMIFEIFLKFHWVLFIGVIVLSLVHGAGVVMAGAGIWAFDILCRCFVLWNNRRNSAKVLAVKLPADVVRLSFKKKDFKYKSGQYVFICIPKVTYFEWHPFSISSSPHNDDVYLHIRVLGNWTKQLYEVADSTEITAFIDGPYGQPAVDIDSDKYKILLFISGGIGITPMQSICNDVIHQYKRGRPLKHVIFVWSVRDAFMVTSVLDYDKQYFGTKIPHQLPYSFSPDLLSQNLNESILDAQLYLTRAREPKDYAQANINPSLQSCLRMGRPKVPEIFENVQKLAISSNEQNVAVLSCGPAPLVADVLKNSHRFSKNGVNFDFHSELFEF